MDLVAADANDVLAVGDFLPHGLVVVQRVAATGRRRPVTRCRPASTCRHRAAPVRSASEQRGLARAVAADDADDGALRHDEAQVLDEQSVAEALATRGSRQTLSPSRGPAGCRAPRSRCAPGLLGQQLLETLQARLALGLAAAWVLRTHSSSALIARCRARSCCSSTPGALSFAPARRCSCPRTECRGRGRAPESSRRRCPGSSGRG